MFTIGNVIFLYIGYGAFISFADFRFLHICNNQAKGSPTLNFLTTLVSIKSQEEQQFLERYFSLKQVVLWIAFGLVLKEKQIMKLNLNGVTDQN